MLSYVTIQKYKNTKNQNTKNNNKKIKKLKIKKIQNTIKEKIQTQIQNIQNARVTF